MKKEKEWHAALPAFKKSFYEHFSVLDLLQSLIFMAPCRKKSRTCTVTTINTDQGGGEPEEGKVQPWSLTGIMNESGLSAQYVTKNQLCFSV